MLIKTIVSIIFAPFILASELLYPNKPVVYVSPNPPQEIQSTKATSTKVVSKNNEEKKTVAIVATTTAQKPKKVPKIETSSASNIPKIQIPEPNFEQINTNSRKTIVNIFCTTKYNDLSPISGTGVIISGDGLILTNAHIGQYLLLKDFREKDYLKCVGRTGSPAYPKYNLELVYISPNWVAENKRLLKEQNPQGTGENDFSFLRITSNIDGTPIENFIYIEPNTNESINVGEPVLLVSYPAGFLGGLSIIQDLNITSAITKIQDVFTFRDGTIDVVSVGGTVVSQKGSSGGLVVDRNTSLIGIITTSSDGETTSTRGLNAITSAYISRDLNKEEGINLNDFIKLDHKTFSSNFLSNKAPDLAKQIIDVLSE